MAFSHDLMVRLSESSDGIGSSTSIFISATCTFSSSRDFWMITRFASTDDLIPFLVSMPEMVFSLAFSSLYLFSTSFSLALVRSWIPSSILFSMALTASRSILIFSSLAFSSSILDSFSLIPSSSALTAFSM